MFDNILKLAEVPGVPREIFCNKILKKNIRYKKNQFKKDFDF